MENEPKSYSLPTQSISQLETSYLLADIVEIRDFIENRSIQTKNTRIERYIEYFESVASKEPRNGSLIFKNSIGRPFESDLDWFLYALREVHELTWILRGLKMHVPAGLDGKLEEMVSGSDFAVLDTNSHSRNVQFELRIASYFCQAGCEVDLTTATDVVAFTEEHAYYVECKRVGSMSQLNRRLKEAKIQLHNRMPRKHDNRIAYGCIAADVTKAAFAHNGLTMGLTNEHSRDVIQEKLINIANTTRTMQLFSGRLNILEYWLQIHLPSLITYPPATITRFSNYFIQSGRIDRETQKALKEIRSIHKVSDHQDEREIPPQPLTLRSTLNVPAGTQYWFDDDLLREFLEGGRVTGKKQEDLIAKFIFNDIKHEFSFFEFEMLVARIPLYSRNRMAENVSHARAELVLELYMQRYPYENIETGGYI